MCSAEYQAFEQFEADLEHRQTARLWPARKSRIESCDLRLAQGQIAGSGILRHMVNARRLWDREHHVFTREKGQRDLAWRRAMSVGNPLQHLPSLAARRRKFIVTERRIGGNADT